VTDPGKAVFLSYASQDAEAAQNLCNVLRAAGIEVWFDQSELRGGDAWDASIRKNDRRGYPRARLPGGKPIFTLEAWRGGGGSTGICRSERFRHRL
jgi:hypothetical protein